MKHLKHINEWTSNASKKCRMGYDNEETDTLVQTIKDICLDLEDFGFDISVSKMLPKSDQIFVRIQWRKYKSGVGNFYEKEDLDSVITRIKDLMKQSGWFLSDTEPGDRFLIDEYLKFTKEKEKEYVSFGDGVAHTNF